MGLRGLGIAGFTVIEIGSSALDVDSMNPSNLFVNFLLYKFLRVLVLFLPFIFLRSRPNAENLHKMFEKKKTETQTKKKLRRYVFGIHAVRGNVTKPGSAKGKPQFATKPGSTKGKGPSSGLDALPARIRLGPGELGARQRRGDVEEQPKQ